MIIVAHSSTLLAPHQHPENKPESYHVLEGELQVNIFDDEGKLIKEKNYLLTDILECIELLEKFGINPFL